VQGRFRGVSTIPFHLSLNKFTNSKISLGMREVGLIGALSLAAYISRICFRRPNPTPSIKHSKDTIITFSALPDLREYVFLGLAAAHVVLTAQFPPKSSLLCPHPEILDQKYFTWSPYVKTCLGVIYAAGALRILAFNTLGKSFTFELAKPDKLVTTGIYAYMQHPSYLPDGLITMANIALFANLDSWPGMFLPHSLVELWIRTKPIWLVSAALFYAAVMSFRIREEEDMLHEAFGREWEDWHRRTARFIPGII
jgi:protein-S-isoprenylcysteine O-methyltransferase Ste14